MLLVHGGTWCIPKLRISRETQSEINSSRALQLLDRLIEPLYRTLSFQESQMT
jgi:hypothetical protein